GHNMRAGTMFATLHRFEDADFFDKNNTMTVYTPYKKLDYEIVSAFVYDDSHIMNSFDFNKDEVYKSFLDNVLDPRSLQSNVRKGAKLDTSDRILILSTCLNYGEGRYLVVGKLTGETDLQPPAAQ
ncbi:MAG: class B sortase, partial [Ruminococcus sp.]|nr:class B sortase [Ruminococcus sp.]